MATIKSFTDLQQSKRLAEILPLESADMTWVSNGLGKPFARTIPIKGDPEELCACWSLAALLGVLPKHIPHKDSKIIQEKENWCYNWRINDKCLYYACNIIKENRCINVDFFICCYYTENVIDACYEMILKLNELNLL